MTAHRLHIPPDIRFSDLKISLRHDGGFQFDLAPVLRVCDASGIAVTTDPESREYQLGAVVLFWYHQHREEGGDPDPILENLREQTRLEQERGVMSPDAGNA